jgi:ketosteroid isomerase-like protein
MVSSEQKGVRCMQQAEGVKGSAAEDREALERLNAAYVRAVDQADVGWFERHLTQDFLNTNPDGSLVERAAFLAQIARGAGVTDLKGHDVHIRILGDFAIIHARTTYRMGQGTEGSGRYTDIWQRRDRRWQCVAAHVNRSAD